MAAQPARALIGGLRPRSPEAELLSAVGVTGLGVAVAMAIVGVSLAGFALGAVLFLAVAAVAMARIASHHPHDRLGLANRITLVRAGGAATLAGVLPTPALLASPAAAWTAFLAVLLLLLLDGADGLAARRQGLASGFGARFDMEVDAVLILVLAAIAVKLGVAGAWVLALGLLRYVFVLAGWLLPWLRRPLPPSLRRRVVCAGQVAVLACLLAPPMTSTAAALLAGAALAALAASFATDILWLARRR